MPAMHQVKDKFLPTSVERLGLRGDQYQNLGEPLKHTSVTYALLLEKPSPPPVSLPAPPWSTGLAYFWCTHLSSFIRF